MDRGNKRGFSQDLSWIIAVNTWDTTIDISKGHFLSHRTFFEFFGPQMALAYRHDAISQGPKNSQIPGPNPLPLALVMDMHASKTLRTGLYKS
jgi:hypothetical protein